MSKRRNTTSKLSKPIAAAVTLLPSTNIPLDRLCLSNDNVRHIKNGVTIEHLADSIARRSLLQSLSVRPVLNDHQKETGDYEVQGGGRRFTALKLLVKQKRLAPNADVPCIVKTTGTVEDDSLAENTDRENLHPLDEFRAFQAMTMKGMPEADIAAAYHVTPAVVRQRLKLASASPTLLKAYAEDELTLEQLMAFCISDDHKRQNAIWTAIGKNHIHPSPRNIRQALTETSVRADDSRALFIGLDAYEKAGGPILRDLFAEEDSEGSYLQDPALLAKLVGEKLEAARDAFLAQGWKWAEASIDIDYSHKQGLTRLTPTKSSIPRDNQAKLKKLTEEYDRLIEDENDIPDGISERLDELQAEIDRLSTPTLVFKKKDMARAGVFIEIGNDGQLDVQYGYVRAEDRLAADIGKHDQDGDDTDLDDGEDAQDHQDDAASGNLPDRLVQDLTAYRTVALRDCLAQDFNTAFRAVLYNLCLSHFDFYGARSCLQITSQEAFPAQAPGLEDMPSSKAIEERHQRWAGRMPEKASDLWHILGQLSFDEEQDLFAHCVSLTINAVREPHRERRDELRHADQLAKTLNLDMVQKGWTPTEENYFSRITKAQIIEAIREAKDEHAVHLIADLKKPTMAKEAARLVQGTGWLPLPLRKATASTATAEGHQPAVELPAFLETDDATGALPEAAE